MAKKYKRLAAFLAVLMTATGAWAVSAEALHDFHISRTKVEYVAKDASLEVTLHIFIDDLEEALSRTGVTGLRLGSEREAGGADEQVEKYLRQHFQLTINGRPAAFEYIGKETSEDLMGLYVYLLYQPIAAPKQMTVRNDVLLEVFRDQQNIVQVVGPDRQPTSLLLRQGQPAQEVRW